MFASSQKIDPFKKIDIILTQTCCVLIQLHRGAICPGDNTVLGQFWAEIMHKKLLLSYEKDIEQIAPGGASHLIFW